MRYIQLFENFQLANSVYFSKGLIPEDIKSEILKIAKNQNYIKLLCDYYVKTNNTSFNELYDELLDYNPNIFPLVGFNLYHCNEDLLNDLFQGLVKRRILIQNCKLISPLIFRNFKRDIKHEYTISEIMELSKLSGEAYSNYKQMEVVASSKQADTINRKCFSSDKDLIFCFTIINNYKNILVGGLYYNLPELMYLIKSTKQEYKIADNYVIVHIKNSKSCKLLGKNTLLCFSIEKDLFHWNSYKEAEADIYFIYDLNGRGKNFMYCLVKYKNDFILYDATDDIIFDNDLRDKFIKLID